MTFLQDTGSDTPFLYLYEEDRIDVIKLSRIIIHKNRSVTKNAYVYHPTFSFHFISIESISSV